MQQPNAPLSTLNVYQLQVLANRSAHDLRKVQKELRVRRRRMLSRFFTDPGRFNATLERHSSVISGSFALNFLEGEGGWQANDLDVYVPFEEFQSVRNYLVNAEGYQEDQEETQRRHTRAEAAVMQHALAAHVVRDAEEAQLLPPVETGICQVASIYRDGKKIDVVQSRSSSALYAIAHFWSTLQMNFLSARGFSCAYPSLTFRRIGVINPLVQTSELMPRAYIDLLVPDASTPTTTYCVPPIYDHSKTISRSQARSVANATVAHLALLEALSSLSGRWDGNWADIMMTEVA
ncbi:hypothetical protein NM688_g1190 [Phlebia brevispora]|uniref:Uncharacterized protein n=1 Tax=Phlebia brevispora TaxID=194682 RepID=A0ACC1TCA7_9APHY|nr:hypothetical protein NM688_g1190 [Phlebia brevispora]